MKNKKLPGIGITGAYVNMEVPGKTRIYGTRGGLKFSCLTRESPEIIRYKLDTNEIARSVKLKANMKKHINDHYAMIEYFLDVLNGKNNR